MRIIKRLEKKLFIFCQSFTLAGFMKVVSFIVKIHLLHKAVYKVSKEKPVHVQEIKEAKEAEKSHF